MDERDDEFWDDSDDQIAGTFCGRWYNGRLIRSCALAGTEECDFECPFRVSLANTPGQET